MFILITLLICNFTYVIITNIEMVKTLVRVNKIAIGWITQMSLQRGVIPGMCPICGIPVEKLVVHHWEKEDGYRRMCASCNSLLGVIYRGVYPESWDEQFEALSKALMEYPVPSFDGREASWSVLVPEELEILQGIEASGMSRFIVDFREVEKELGKVTVDAGDHGEAFTKAFDRLDLEKKHTKSEIRHLVRISKISPWVRKVVVEKEKGIVGIKKDIEKLMKVTLKEVREETLCAKLLGIFLQARELLDGSKPNDS